MWEDLEILAFIEFFLLRLWSLFTFSWKLNPPLKKLPEIYGIVNLTAKYNWEVILGIESFTKELGFLIGFEKHWTFQVVEWLNVYCMQGMVMCQKKN